MKRRDFLKLSLGCAVLSACGRLKGKGRIGLALTVPLLPKKLKSKKRPPAPKKK